MKIRKVPASWLDAPLKSTSKKAGPREDSKLKRSMPKNSEPKDSRLRDPKAQRLR